MDSSLEQEFEHPESPFSDVSADSSSGLSTKKKRAKRSATHHHFNICDGKWNCNLCSATFVIAKGGSTTSALRHLKSKHPDVCVSVEAGTPESVFSSKVFQDKLADTVVMECLPFSFVDSPVVKDLLHYCNPGVVLPSRFKLKSDIMAKFDSEKSRLIEIFKNYPGKVACITDNWTSSNMHPYQGVIVQYIDSTWELQSFVIDLTILEGSHTGENMAAALIEVLTEFNILEKLIAITTDNASNNSTMMRAVAREMNVKELEFDSKNNYVRCFAHIVNLACTAAFNTVKDLNPCDLLPDEENDEDDISLISKLRRGIKFIRKSTIKREMFRRHCVASNVKHNELLLDVKTRWNSTYYMIKRFLKLRVPYHFTLSSDSEMAEYIISDSEITVLENIKALLKPFKTATKDISNQHFPTISLCAVLYVELFNHLEKYFPNDSNKNEAIDKETQELYPEWLQAAAKSAHEKLDGYYPTSDALVHVIGSVMDPRCKIQWFRENFSPDIVRSYKKTVTEYWTKHYKPTVEEMLNQTVSPGKPKNPWARQMQSKSQTSKTKDELETYLSEKTSINSDKTALDWWRMREEDFPNLAKMARDFLAISGSGVPVECLFSNGPDLLRNRRQSLSDETIRRCLCLKMWLTKKTDYKFGKAASEKMGGRNNENMT